MSFLGQGRGRYHRSFSPLDVGVVKKDSELFVLSSVSLVVLLEKEEAETSIFSPSLAVTAAT